MAYVGAEGAPSLDDLDAVASREARKLGPDHPDRPSSLVYAPPEFLVRLVLDLSEHGAHAGTNRVEWANAWAHFLVLRVGQLTDSPFAVRALSTAHGGDTRAAVGEAVQAVATQLRGLAAKHGDVLADDAREGARLMIDAALEALHPRSKDRKNRWSFLRKREVKGLDPWVVPTSRSDKRAK